MPVKSRLTHRWKWGRKPLYRLWEWWQGWRGWICVEVFAQMISLVSLSCFTSKIFKKNSFPMLKSSSSYTILMEVALSTTIPIQIISSKMSVPQETSPYKSSLTRRQVLFPEMRIASCMVNISMGIALGTSATVWKNKLVKDYSGNYFFVECEDLIDGKKDFCFPLWQRTQSSDTQTKFNRFLI